MSNQSPEPNPPQSLNVFGMKLDPMELVLHFGIFVMFMIPAARRSVAPDFTWQEAAGWFGGLSSASAIVRVAPTQRLNAYKDVFNRDEKD